MVEIERLLKEIDELSPAELEVVYRHIIQRRQPSPRDVKKATQTMLPVYEQTDRMSDAEIDEVIKDALE